LSNFWKKRKHGYTPNLTIVKIAAVGLWALAKVIIANLESFKKIRLEARECSPLYLRPKRRYELPEYKKGMPYCYSRKKYFRRTLYCNPWAPEVIALANKLGAFKKSSRDFAESAFRFVKRKITLEILPMDEDVATLQRGTGTCIQKLSVFISLCRCAGIPSRYKLYSLATIQSWYDTFIAVDPLMRKWYDALGYFMMHGSGEVLIKGRWIPADVGPTPERQAASGIPITRFGEESIGIWTFPIPGTLMHLESLPVGLTFVSKLLMNKLSPRTVDKINASILSQIERGGKILDKVGERVYNEEKRKIYRPKMPTINLKKH